MAGDDALNAEQRWLGKPRRGKENGRPWGPCLRRARLGRPAARPSPVARLSHRQDDHVVAAFGDRREGAGRAHDRI